MFLTALGDNLNKELKIAMKLKKFSLYDLLVNLEKQSRLSLFLISTAFVILLGLIDYWTGFDLAFSFFYIIPVAISSWGIGGKTGLFFSFVSAATWFLSNWFAGETVSSAFLASWNTAIRLGFFVVISILLDNLRDALKFEKNLARTDPLTSVLNRRAFYELAGRKIVLGQRVRRPFSVIYMDLDNFKQVNDQLGHSMGDEVLKTVADVMRLQIRIDDLIARLGGDEFVIWLTDADADSAKRITSRLQKVLLEEMQARHLGVTFSIGVITFLQVPESIDKIIGLTDDLMYNIKGTGKDAVNYALYGEP
jgi:diguanylate cyclase (GGDEF)-like protein